VSVSVPVTAGVVALLSVPFRMSVMVVPCVLG
jgi:hypothetical protein